VLTFHAAKGREWPAVLLIGVEPGLLPHSSARTDDAKREEARLAYVACTRAADHLIISWVDQRGGKRAGPSPLIRGVPTGEWAPAPPPEDIRRRSRERRASAEPRRDALRTWRSQAARAAGLPDNAIVSDDEIDMILAAPSVDAAVVCSVVGDLRGARLAPRIVAALDRSVQDAGG